MATTICGHTKIRTLTFSILRLEPQRRSPIMRFVLVGCGGALPDLFQR